MFIMLGICCVSFVAHLLGEGFQGKSVSRLETTSESLGLSGRI